MTTETGGCSPAQKKTATESEIRVRTGAVITLTGILVLYFSRYAYVLEAAAAIRLSSRTLYQVQHFAARSNSTMPIMLSIRFTISNIGYSCSLNFSSCPINA